MRLVSKTAEFDEVLDAWASNAPGLFYEDPRVLPL